MATPRKKWFKVADSILHENIDNDALATLVRLMALMNTRWARDGLSAEEAGSISMLGSQIPTVTKMRRFDASLGVLARLAHALGGFTVSVEGCAPGVYFYRIGDRVKIGKTMDPARRFKQIEAAAGEVGECVAWVPTLELTSMERSLHAHYSDARLEGEWFDAGRVLPIDYRIATEELPTDYRRSRLGEPAVVISWPKWSDFQGLAPRESPPPQTQDARRKTQTKKGAPKAAPSVEAVGLAERFYAGRRTRMPMAGGPPSSLEASARAFDALLSRGATVEDVRLTLTWLDDPRCWWRERLDRPAKFRERFSQLHAEALKARDGLPDRPTAEDRRRSERQQVAMELLHGKGGAS